MQRSHPLVEILDADSVHFLRTLLESQKSHPEQVVFLKAFFQEEKKQIDASSSSPLYLEHWNQVEMESVLEWGFEADLLFVSLFFAPLDNLPESFLRQIEECEEEIGVPIFGVLSVGTSLHFAPLSTLSKRLHKMLFEENLPSHLDSSASISLSNSHEEEETSIDPESDRMISSGKEAAKIEIPRDTQQQDSFLDSFWENIRHPQDKSLPVLQKRESQEQIANSIWKAFLNENSLHFIEAGTGVGKSFAYLLPAILVSKGKEKRVLVSTFSKALQNQLFQKDLPDILKRLNIPISYSLFKGIKNYLCVRNFELLDPPNLFDAEEKEAYRLTEQFIRETRDGDLAHLSPTISSKWKDKISASSEECENKKCVFFSQCYYFKAKQNAAKSQIVVVNHHLLLSQMRMHKEGIPHSLLPNSDYVIVDEAHRFFENLHLEERFSFSTLGESLSQIYLPPERAGNKKLIWHSIQKAFSLNQSLIDTLVQIEEEWKQVFLTLLPELEEMESQILALWANAANSEDTLMVNFKSPTVLTQEILSIFQRILPPLMAVRSHLLEVKDLLEEASSESEGLEFLGSFYGLIHKWIYTANLLEQICLAQDNEDYVFWLEKRNLKSGKKLYLCSALVSVADFFQSTFLPDFSSHIFLSATLAGKPDMSDLKYKLQLNQVSQEIHFSQFSSPFRKKEMSKLLIAKNLRVLSSPSTARQDWNEIALFLKEALEYSDGGALILCTSHEQVQFLHDSLNHFLPEHQVKMQENQNISHVVEEMKENPRFVLIGTNTLWEGIDIPGFHLRLVVIVKLPFSSPGNPLQEALQVEARKKNKTPFEEISLPQAIMRWKQGLGRLIRSETDSGAILCLDDRLVTKGYGKQFLNSLEEPISSGSKEQMLKELESFFKPMLKDYFSE